VTPISVANFPGQYRIHVGMPVVDLEQSQRFYQALLGCPATKLRPGYVKFEPVDPVLNLSLVQVTAVLPCNPELHFGLQVKSPDCVCAAHARLEAAGYAVRIERETICCYAVQDKVWAEDPDGHRWEIFYVLESAMGGRSAADDCCGDFCCSSDLGSSADEPVPECNCHKQG
jgi:catechol 2,3-dioxygenase-like lactoylglutathione lyase family enzyme